MAECLAAIHLCRVRATRLNADGTPKAGPNNSYVTDKPLVINVTPVLEAGADKTVVGGCDCIVATYRGKDKLKRFDLELDLAVIEPALKEILLGSPVIIDGTNGPIGNWWTEQAFDCSSEVQPNVALEGWQTAWDDDAPSPVYPYVHWVWPSSFWQIGAHSLQNDFAQPKLTGYTRGNPNWGLGIYGDQPEAAGRLGGYFYSHTIPAASCGYLSHSIT